MLKVLAILLFGFLPLFAHAEAEVTLVRKLVVFPIADANFASSDDAWWQMRETLTKDKKLFIAAKRFMINRGVFQPRRTLKPADVIILGRLLDAEALVVTYVEDRSLKMKVYEAENGYLLWETEAQFHPAIPINDQLIKISSKMMADFLEAIPYQGFTEKNSAEEKVLYEKEGKKYADVFAGGRATVKKGDLVQWISITGESSSALYATAKEKVIAEGIVDEVNGDHLVVEVKGAVELEDITVDSVVRFPKEMSKLQDLYQKEGGSDNWSGEYFRDELKPISEFEKDHHPAATGVGFFANLIAFILLAF